MSFAAVASIFEKRILQKYWPSQLRRRPPRSALAKWAWLLFAVLLLQGCAGTRARQATFPRHFTFGADTFSYRNDLKWSYYHDPETGEFKHRPRIPEPDYTHHCFVVARAARQFFQHARFEPALPQADEATYRARIRQVISTSPRTYLAENERIVIPGYTNLFDFSRSWEALLKAECGGAWQSYFQRGHWRMILPFSREHQRAAAEDLAESIRRNRPPLVHLAKFPQLTINHAVVLFGVEESEKEIRFAVYDPYEPWQQGQLTFDRELAWFQFPGNDYFVGGKLNVYEIYCSRLY
jgi:hypothetical protein